MYQYFFTNIAVVKFTYVIHDVCRECKFTSLQSRGEHSRATRPGDRACVSCVTLRGALLNYCPALHALNRVKKKRGKETRACIVFAETFSREISRVQRIGEGSAAEITATDRLTIAIVITRDRALAVEKLIISRSGY